MSVIGIEKLEFGVEDLPTCEKFMQDFGLQAAQQHWGERQREFTTLSGARGAASVAERDLAGGV